MKNDLGPPKAGLFISPNLIFKSLLIIFCLLLLSIDIALFTPQPKKEAMKEKPQRNEVNFVFYTESRYCNLSHKRSEEMRKKIIREEHRKKHSKKE